MATLDTSEDGLIGADGGRGNHHGQNRWRNRREAGRVRSSLLRHLITFTMGSSAMLKFEIAWRLFQLVIAFVGLVASAREGCESANLLRIWLGVFGVYSLYMIPFATERHRAYSDPGAFVSQYESDRKKALLDMSYIAWYVTGVIWLYGATAASCTGSAPVLYGSALTLISLGALAMVLPLLLCASLCCCMPCVLAVLRSIRTGEVADDAQPGNQGASEEELKALPEHEYRPDQQASGGGEFSGRRIQGDDAFCCVCLTEYSNGESVSELSCGHHFHSGCIREWLRVNATCPICKLPLQSATSEIPV